MVSSPNREETVAHFKKEKFFGYREDNFVFFE